MDEYDASLQPHEQHSVKQESPSHDVQQEADDLDLENAIGDAFKQFAMLNPPEGSSHEHPVFGDSSLEDKTDVDLESVVGDVFGSLNRQFSSDSSKPQYVEHPASGPDTNGSIEYRETDHIENGPLEGATTESPTHAAVTDHASYANNADANADANINANADTHANANADTHADTSDVGTNIDNIANTALEDAIGDAFKSLAKASPREELDYEDQKLEEAIGDVFSNLTKNDTEKESHETPTPSSDEVLRQAITQSLNSIYDKKDETPAEEPKDELNLAGIVQDVVGRINSGDAKPQDSKRRQSFIDDLAGEISHQVSMDRTKAIPVLDDNVLAHFQTVANKEDQNLDSAIKSAVASAVNSAQSSSKAQVLSTEQEMDLEKLHMNEILQNAFNMAMSNPQELITSLDMDEAHTSANIASDAHREQPNALSTAAAIAALSVKDAFSKKDDSVSEPKDATTKPLSIAQTLAMHRASMGTAKRDYSAIQTLEDSMKTESPSLQMNPQLSNILSSLSHHIQSGTQSQNLMVVIRQMTNALMLTKTSISVTKRVQEIVQDFKKSADFTTCIGDLKQGKRYLACCVEDSKRSQTLLSSIVGYMDPQEKNAEVKIEDELIRDQKELKELYDCAHAAISNYNSTRFRAALAGLKRDVSSSEYKERVRTENRERKKKWREENAERNKDNDLRARVLRRAAYMFGEGNSQEKTIWMEDEFSKRREKRFARQQKEENSDSGMSEPSASETKGKASSQNTKLSTLIGKYVHLVGESGSEMVPEAALAATCAVISVAAWRHSTDVGVGDVKQVQSTINVALNTTLDGSIRSGDYMKLPFLVKSESKNSDLKTKYEAMMEVRPETVPQKRDYEGFLKEAKKTRTDDLNYDFSKAETEPQARASQWSASSALKMPHYRKPLGGDTQQASEQDRDIATKPAISPFISNRMGKDSPIATPSGLRKPGSFQRPAYARPKSTGGFSALYSTSFKQN